VTAARTAPGQLRLRDAPPGLPESDLRPPTIAESGDPFAAARIAALIARLERGQPIRIADVVDRLNATYVDWLFTDRVVVDAILQLQTNWMAKNKYSVRHPAAWVHATIYGACLGLALNWQAGVVLGTPGLSDDERIAIDVHDGDAVVIGVGDEQR
jgi:hypothetical protein